MVYNRIGIDWRVNKQRGELVGIEKFLQQSKEKQDAVLAAGVEEFSQKSYSDAGTDAIIQKCGISKGLLFHYFGSKKDFYYYCLSQALNKLIMPTVIPQGSFYDILFSVMDQKLQTCAKYPAETRFANMASREMSGEVAKGKAEILMDYSAQIRAQSEVTMGRALAALPIKEQVLEKVKDGLQFYCNALINRYLLTYQNAPEAFFERAPQIKDELKDYIDIMLYGIIQENKK